MNRFFYSLYSIALASFLSLVAGAQTSAYTHADSLKGSIGKARIWWDVVHYDLHATFNEKDSTVGGYNVITYKVVSAFTRMQLDLMTPMLLDSVVQENKKLSFRRDGNAFFIDLIAPQPENSILKLTAYFHGKPRVAKMPPWDGGVVWSKDPSGNPWISIACQGMAAQVWFPNKDHMYDEPEGCTIHITAPRSLISVSNGRLINVQLSDTVHATYVWEVKNPINNYNIIPYIGKYVNMADTLQGEKGTLDLAYWVLVENYEKAKKHFQQTKSMLHCFEHWFGPYPFYEDGYKLVEAPFLGMEHQSAIAYGNGYKSGYLGRDLSSSGWGLKWDFIIVHESGHEWFGNNISAKDVADNWIHESFTAYAENLYTEYLYGKQAGAEYVIGTRKAILNDKPIISPYGVNAGGSLDLYYKGANMLHTMRQIVNNDSLWRSMLRGLNADFRHQTVTSKQIEDYLIQVLKIDFQKTFDQYLRTTQIPVLEYKLKKNKLTFRWTNCVKGFNMPVKINTSEKEIWLTPLEKWQSTPYQDTVFKINENFYVTSLQIQ